ncbi:sulfatase [Sunxiuqinia sp. A32]|uniref:sulfatase n=1 Tax=Sunxiuqinia sp. A32 TaxID=3461496 RepID=UPI0040453BFF
MKRNDITLLLGGLSLFCSVSVAFSHPAKSSVESKSKPNIVLILADDQGWGATSVLMNPQIKDSKSDFIQTPNLERFAEKAVVFTNGYASHPNCSPTRGSLLTGKSPAKLHLTDIIERHSGALYNGNKLNPPTHISGMPSEETTIAELIKSNLPEYTTAHFGKWHLGNGGPEMHGFDASDGKTTNREGNFRLEGNPKDIFGITKRAISWMDDQVAEKKPFYLQLSHYATHLGIETTKETLDKVRSRTPGERHIHSAYAGMAEDLDQGVGLILDEIKRLGISDNTYVIYVADNGGYPLNNPSNINGPLHGWKATIWEGGIRVPFMITGPGIKHAYSNVPVVAYDLLPTIGDWLGIKDLPKGIEGGSLASLLNKPKSENKVDRDNDFLVFHFPHYQLQKGGQPSSAIVQGDFKLIKFYEDNSFYLFDLKNDISEENNLAQKFPEKVKELDKKLTDYLEKIDAGLPVPNPEYDEAKDPGRKFQSIKSELLEKPYFVIH